jgi:hypothetical protein
MSATDGTPSTVADQLLQVTRCMCRNPWGSELPKRGWTVALLLALTFGAHPALGSPIGGDRLLNIFEGLDDYGPMWQAFNRVFPTQTHALFDEVSAKYAKGGNGSAGAISAELIQRAQQLLWDNRRFVLSAPDDRLLAWATTQATNLRDLRGEDVAECAYAALHGGPPPKVTPASARVRIRITISELSLVEGGRDSAVDRSALSAGDVATVIEAAREAGASPEALDAWQHGTLATGSPEEQCDIAITITGALSNVPPSVAGRVVELTLRAGTKGSPDVQFGPLRSDGADR